MCLDCEAGVVKLVIVQVLGFASQQREPRGTQAAVVEPRRRLHLQGLGSVFIPTDTSASRNPATENRAGLPPAEDFSSSCQLSPHCAQRRCPERFSVADSSVCQVFILLTFWHLLPQLAMFLFAPKKNVLWLEHNKAAVGGWYSTSSNEKAELNCGLLNMQGGSAGGY